MSKTIAEWRESFSKETAKTLKGISNALDVLKENKDIDKHYFDDTGLGTIKIIVEGELNRKEHQEQEHSLLNAIEQGDKEQIKDLEQRAKKGETIRLI